MRRVSESEQPSYLQPYQRAVKRHGANFNALLWASQKTQRQRFEALVKMQDPSGLVVLDLGCGRADLLDFMIDRGVPPKRYVGVEGVAELAEAAQAKGLPNARIIKADFLREPRRLSAAAPDVIYCSGALNTIDSDDFYLAIRNGFAACRRAMVFNFLSSPLLAGVSYLRWYERRDVMEFARALTPHVEKHEGYIDGDCTIAMRKEGAGE
jgi:SAM-dependent methyltransferase